MSILQIVRRDIFVRRPPQLHSDLERKAALEQSVDSKTFFLRNLYDFLNSLSITVSHNIWPRHFEE